MKRCFVLPSCLLAVSLTLSASADDFAGESFSLRFPGTLTHFSSYGDVAAKAGASAASKWGSSSNPAAIGWGFPAAYDYGIGGQYSALMFQEGTRLDFFTEVATFDAGQLGAFRFALAQVRSSDSTLRGTPLHFNYDLNLVRLDWSKRFTDRFSAGAGVSVSRSETTLGTAKRELNDTDKDTVAATLGVLAEPVDHLFIGLVGDYHYGTSQSRSTAHTPIGEFYFDSGDVTHQFSIRPGIAYEFRENALVHLDYQLAWLSNDTGSLTLQRVMLGTDIPLARFFYLRAGTAIDAHRNLTWTTGLGFYPRKGLYFDVAYQHDMFPEVQREFGHSQTLNASISWQF